MKILLQYGPEHGRTITSDRAHSTDDQVYVREDRYIYVLTDKEDDRGRRIATVSLD
ncbi:hypothetical protein ACFV8T_38075 [Streptomyces sp. NPDC059832]|uniref:hypothetical protein n=1 Tax=unclassified Streptomyces TaxID=2593676 RepID=UPI0036468B41